MPRALTPPSAGLPGCGSQPECWGAQGTPPHPGGERAKATAERGKRSTGSGAMVCGDIPGDMPPRAPGTHGQSRGCPMARHLGTEGGHHPWGRPELRQHLCCVKNRKWGFVVFWGFFFPFVSKREDCRACLSQEICYKTAICLSCLSHPSIDPKDELPWISLILFFMFPQANEYLWIVSPEPKHGPYNRPW